MNPDFKTLTPTQFENLAYDLLTARGLANATWRTPGADGGRDIEGTWSHVDISGEQTTQVWYVDCKHHTKSVNWPTVFEKVSYAVSNAADYLLIVCTPSLSPACRTEVKKWNDQRKRPLIRAWESHYLSALLAGYSEIAAKYGFLPATILQLPGFVDIVVEASKSAASAYTRASILSAEGPSKELELAAALAGFVSEKMQQFSLRGTLLEVSPFTLPEDGYDWVNWSGLSKASIDRSAVRAVLSLTRLSSKQKTFSAIVATNSIRIEPSTKPFEVDANSMTLLRKICLLGSVEYLLDEHSLNLTGAKI
jgi:hypothetical protein